MQIQVAFLGSIFDHFFCLKISQLNQFTGKWGERKEEEKEERSISIILLSSLSPLLPLSYHDKKKKTNKQHKTLFLPSIQSRLSIYPICNSFIRCV